MTFEEALAHAPSARVLATFQGIANEEARERLTARLARERAERQSLVATSGPAEGESGVRLTKGPTRGR